MTDQPQTVGYASASGAFPASASATVSDRGLNAARGMRPWLILFAVLLFIGVGFGALTVLFLLVAGVAGGISSGEPTAAVVLGIFALLYAVPVVLGLLLGLHLIRSASAIGRLSQTRDGGDLDDALVHMKAY